MSREVVDIWAGLVVHCERIYPFFFVDKIDFLVFLPNVQHNTPYSTFSIRRVRAAPSSLASPAALVSVLRMPLAESSLEV